MLKGVPDNISSELLKALADMGHGDSIAIVDHFYPACSKSGGRFVEAKGNTVPQIMDSVLNLIPLDVDYDDMPVRIMKPDPGFENQVGERNPVWEEMIAAVEANEPEAKAGFIGRTEFYEQAEKAFITVSTSEQRTYGCVLLHKGVK